MRARKWNAPRGFIKTNRSTADLSFLATFIIHPVVRWLSLSTKFQEVHFTLVNFYHSQVFNTIIEKMLLWLNVFPNLFVFIILYLLMVGRNIVKGFWHILFPHSCVSVKNENGLWNDIYFLISYSSITLKCDELKLDE